MSPDYGFDNDEFDAEWTDAFPPQDPHRVPLEFPATIAGHQYMIDLAQLRMTTMQVRRVSLDDSVEPGEQSLNAAGVWPRAQDNWFLGAGQMFLDNRFAFQTIYTHSGESPSVRTRFWRSKGLYINTEGNLSLQPLQESKYSTANTNLQAVACGSYLYVADGDSLLFSDDPTQVSPSWITVGTAASPITSLTTDGSRVWAACGVAGVYVTHQGSTRWERATRPATLATTEGLIASAAITGPIGLYLETSTLYEYGVTAVDSFGNETNLGSGSKVYNRTGKTAYPVTLGWGGNPLATSFNVYRLEEGGVWMLIGNTEAASPTWVDEGRSPPVYQHPPLTNLTGASDYPATFISYCNGYLIGSTGRDLVNIEASGIAQFIYENSSPEFTFTFAFATPTAIHVGGSANGQAFIGAIQPDSATNGANLAPPYTATVLPIGETPNAIAYNAGSIILATSAGVRTGTQPDSAGIFDINAAIIDAAPVQALAAYQNFCYFGWSTFNTSYVTPGIQDSAVFNQPGVITSGLGKLDLSQYTSLGIPAYASDAMTPDGQVTGTVTYIALVNGQPYFVVTGADGTGALWGPAQNKYVPSGWMEAGWTRYSTLEKKILTRGTVQHDPLFPGASVKLDIYDQFGHKNTVGKSSTGGSTGPHTYFEINKAVGERFMPVITLTSSPTTYGQNYTPVLHEWLVYGMVVPIRQDEIMLPIIMKTRTDDLTVGGQPEYMDSLAEYLFLKQLEAGGVPVKVSLGGLTISCYIDQVQVAPAKYGLWNDRRTFPESTVMVKLITLGPIGSGPTAATDSGTGE